MDRRGFGASGDSAEYDLEREFEDVAAVVDAVAARTGGTVDLWGHSYGANCTIGGAALTGNVRHLIVYEPSLCVAYPPGFIATVEELLAQGDNRGVIVAVLVDMMEMTEDEIGAFCPDPVLLAAAPTIPRECRVEEGWVHEPGQFDSITAPTLLLTGSESDCVMAEAPELVAAAIAGSHVRVLDGHDHFAHRTDPATVVEIVNQFIAS